MTEDKDSEKEGMEKYGVEEDLVVEGEKLAADHCQHPAGKLKKDGETVYCTACEKYIKR